MELSNPNEAALTARKATLSDLVSLLGEQATWKTDLVVPAREMAFNEGLLNIRGYGSVNVNDVIDPTAADLFPMGASRALDHAQSSSVMVLEPQDLFDKQLATKLQIPLKYYRRMKSEAVPLLDYNVNHWLLDDPDKKHMVRAFSEKRGGSPLARALLSERYRIMDNYDVLFGALNAIKEAGLNVTVESCDLTETRMYVRIYCQEVAVAAESLVAPYRNRIDPHGDVIDSSLVFAGFVLQNSEVGLGSFSIMPRLVILTCLNGMTIERDIMRRVHMGARLDTGEINWSEKTRNANRELIVAQTGDAIQHFLNKRFLEETVEEISHHGEKSLNHPTGTVQNVTKELATTDAEAEAILDYFVKGGDTRAIGVVQAVTRYAQDVTDGDRASELEVEAFKMLPFIASNYDKVFKN